MTAPRTTFGDSTGINGSWPADVVDFATARQVEGYLGPLLEVARQLFPAADRVQVRLEEDPEIREDRHILFDVQVAGLSLSESRAAARRWNEELLRRCPAPQACLFRLRLDLKR